MGWRLEVRSEDRMRFRKGKLGGTVALLMMATATIWSERQIRPALAAEKKSDRGSSACRLPQADEIESMIADVYCHPFANLVGTDFTGFEIPKKDFDDVLNEFKSCEPDHRVPEEIDLDEIGTIRINLKAHGAPHGGCIRLCWFDRGKQGCLYFSCAGRRYLCRIKGSTGDESMGFDGYIRALYRDAHPEPEANPVRK